MRNRRKPFYSDDSDYTTNSPSYYDDLARKQKLIEMLAKKIWEYEETLDLTLEQIINRLESYIEENNNLMKDRLDEWDLKLEKFPENVELLLEEWLSDGTLDHIINDTIFSWKADQVDLDETNRQLTLITKLVPINLDDVALSINSFHQTLESNHTMKVPAGDYDLHEPLILDKEMNLDFTGVTFTYYGTGTALTVGQDNQRINSKTMILPNIIKNGSVNWEQNINGVELKNVNTSEVYFGDVSLFKQGIKINAINNNGNSYNAYHLKRLINNLESLVLTSIGNGWTNENSFYLGRFGWTSDLKDLVTSENVHVKIEDNGYSQNNNVFYRTSFESSANTGKEFAVKIENGRMIYFRDCRYEYVYNVEINNGTDIQFTNGFGSTQLTFTDLEPSVYISNSESQESKNNTFEYLITQSVNTPIAKYFSVTKDVPKATIEGDGSIISSGKVYGNRGFEWGGGPTQINNKSFLHGTVEPNGNIIANQGSIYIRNNHGELYLKGSGLNTDTGWRKLQSITDSTTASRPVDNTIVGQQHFDRTLGVPIWWNGTNWVNAIGDTV